MRILMTGFSSLQTGRTNKLRAPVRKIDVPEIIVDRLRAMGHVVDWRKTEVNENVSAYDLLWVNVAGAMSFQAPYSLGAFSAIGQASKSYLPTVLFYDDWKVHQTKQHAKQFFARGMTQMEKVLGTGATFYHKDDVELLKRTKVYDQIMLGAQVLMEPERIADMNGVAVFPMYGWGDETEILAPHLVNVPAIRAAKLDFSAYIVEQMSEVAQVVRSSEKKRVHALASLSPQKEWVDEELRPTWPVDYYGSKNLGAPRLKDETDIQMEYAKHWTILSAPYKHCGSGWWRSRFLYGAMVHSIVICDPEECAKLPGYYVSLQDVEQGGATDRRLEELALRQANAFLPLIWTKQRFNTELKRLVSEVHRLGEGIERK